MTLDKQNTKPRAPLIVGIGASAGGLDALGRFFSALKSAQGLTLVVIQHLSSSHKSLMPELLARSTKLPIDHAKHNQVAVAGHIYLIPPGKTLTIRQGLLQLQPKNPAQMPNLPIDTFFESLASEFGERAIDVVLSGTGSDGMRGVRAVKQAGGWAMAQSPESAQFDGMPNSAISTGLIDQTGTPEALATDLNDYAAAFGIDVPAQEVSNSVDTRARLLAQLNAATGVDFSGYRMSTVDRRIARRVLNTRCANLEAYAAFAVARPEELNRLKRELLISVTHFFRDPEAFAELRSLVIEPLVAAASNGSTIRVWVAACATGEEAYTVAMLFLEVIGARDVALKVFGTDIDDAALSVASAGRYDLSISSDIAPELLSRYFHREAANYVVNTSLRQSVLFANHNVLTDPPFTRLSLICCRNMLGGFKHEAQRGAWVWILLAAAL
jgi:two-component system, chemotaxis family, CheB/CheR fusion protein